MYKSPCPCGTPPPMKMSWRWATLSPGATAQRSELDLVPRARFKSDRRRLQAPTVCGSHKGAHVEKDLFHKTSSSLPVVEKESQGGNRCRFSIAIVVVSMCIKS